MVSAEHHAEMILRAAGSSLRHYTMPGTREAILNAVREAMATERRFIINGLRDLHWTHAHKSAGEFFATALEGDFPAQPKETHHGRMA